jgi:hypothetical protein
MTFLLLDLDLTYHYRAVQPSAPTLSQGYTPGNGKTERTSRLKFFRSRDAGSPERHESYVSM